MLGALAATAERADATQRSPYGAAKVYSVLGDLSARRMDCSPANGILFGSRITAARGCS